MPTVRVRDATADDATAVAGLVNQAFGMLSVDPSRQGQGLGRRLVDAAEDRGRSRGCRLMEIHVVDVSEELPPFYRRLG